MELLTTVISGAIARIEHFLYPERESLPEDGTDHALRHVRAAPFDLVQWPGVAAGLAAVTAGTSYAIDRLSPSSRVVAALGNAAIAVPLLTAPAGPFVVRRNRRVQRAELRARSTSPRGTVRS